MMDRPAPNRSRTGRTRTGFVLVAVLVIACVLSLLVARLSISTMTEVELSRSRARAVELRAALDSGAALARSLLAVDAREGGRSDGTRDTWARGPMRVRLGDVDVTLNIRDEDGKVSVPHMLAARHPDDARELQRALRHFVQEAARAFEVEEDQVRRWIVSRQHRLDLPEEMAGEPLFDIPAGPPGAVLAVGRFLTVWAGGTINVNTAPPECLEYLWGRGSDRLVSAVVEHREEEPFTRPAEVFALPSAGRTLRRPGGMRIVTESRFFEIEIVAESGPARLCERVVVGRHRPEVPVVFRQLVPEVSFRGEAREVGIEAFIEGTVEPEEGV